MQTLLILAWMAITSAILNRGGPASDMACLAAQAFILASGSLEVASIETGRDSRMRLPFRVVALVSYLTSVLTSLVGPHL